MSVHIAGIRVHVSTNGGDFGASVNLVPGLNIIRAGNARGKTQFIQALIYGLGMERMLSARANAPVGSVLTTEVAESTGDDEETTYPVRESWVAVELRSEDGQALTVRRYVVHGSVARDLVDVWRQPVIDQPVLSNGEPMFLHAPGSATRERGFHAELSRFLKWELPTVAKFNGDSTLLYPDALFPFLLVDQQSWGSAGARKVERFQIREPSKRAVEFLLALRGPDARLEREQLEAAIVRHRSDWEGLARSIRSTASLVGGRIAGVPDQPAGASNREVKSPTSVADAALELLQDGEWVDASTVLARLDEELAALAAAPPRPQNVGSATGQEAIHHLRDELQDAQAAAILLESDMELGESQLASLERRVAALAEERARHADLRTLQRLGAEVHASHLGDHACPTCHQSLDPIEEGDSVGETLNIDDTIQLLNAQATTTARLRDEAAQALERTSSSLAAIQREADQLKVRLQAAEADAYGPPAEVSRSEVARAVTLELRRNELARAVDEVSNVLEDMQVVANEMARVRTNLRSLPTGDPEEDLVVLNAVTQNMRAHLRSSGFSSYNVNELKLDESALRPTREGFDVDTDASASDVVRTKVAYLESIRSMGAEVGNHPGFLVLDEPRQQDIARDDFGAILRYLAAVTEPGQVVVTSASDADELGDLLDDARGRVNLLDLGSDRIIRRVSNG